MTLKGIVKREHVREAQYLAYRSIFEKGFRSKEAYQRKCSSDWKAAEMKRIRNRKYIESKVRVPERLNSIWIRVVQVTYLIDY